MSALENVLIFDKLNMWSEMRSFNAKGLPTVARWEHVHAARKPSHPAPRASQ